MKVLLGLTINQISLVLSFAIIIVGYFIYLKYIRNKKIEKVEYVRYIPGNLEPELLQTIYYGRVCKDALWITFLNLVKLGAYSIRKTKNDDGEEIQKITFEKRVDGLKSHQKQAMHIINNCMESNTIDLKELKEKINKVSILDYEKFEEQLWERKQNLFIKSAQRLKYTIIALYIFMAILIAVMALLGNIVGENSKIGLLILVLFGCNFIIYSFIFGRIKTKDEAAGWKILIAVLTIIQLPILASIGIHMMYIPYLLLFFIIQRIQRIKIASNEEIKMQEEIEGLKRYIKDYSMLEEKDIEHITLWEDYLIIAIALKLKDNSIDFYYQYCKDNINAIFEKSFIELILF